MSETGYPTPGDVSDNTIMEQTETTYDAASNAIQTIKRMRYHNATGTGELGTPSSTQPKARATYQATWPDAVGRPAATADNGTNGGSALTRPSTVPDSSDIVLVTRITLAASGDLQTITDPAGMVTLMQYDAVGREVAKILNYQTGSSSSRLMMPRDAKAGP